jgi:signal transduction histidine kinase/HAMP domain-containing protein
MTLSKTLVRYFISLTLLALLAVSVVEAYFTYQAQRDAVASRQQLIAQEAADTVQEFMQEKFRLLEIAADQGLGLEGLFRLDSAFQRIARLDVQGNEVAVATRLAGSAPVRLTGQVQQDLLAHIRNKEIYASPVRIEESTGEPMVMIAVPVQDVFGDVQGTIMGEVNLKLMWDIVGSIRVGEEGTAYVVDNFGRLIAAEDVSKVLEGPNLLDIEEVREFVSGSDAVREGILHISRGLQGDWVVANYAEVEIPAWAVMVEMPVAEAYGPILELVLIMALAVFFCVLLAIWGGTFLSRKISEPIISLRNAALRIQEGKLDAAIGEGPANEIGDLARAFDSMRSRLKALIHNLEEERAQLLASINSLSFGFMIVNKRRETIIANSAMENFLGIAAKQGAFTGLVQTFGDTFNFAGAYADAVQKGRSLDTKDIRLPNNRHFRLLIEPVLVRHPQHEIIGAVIALEDVTEQKLLEQSKDDFLAIASHEMRTPLTIIKGYTQQLERIFSVSAGNEKQQTMLASIRKNSDRLLGIINDFLDVMRVEGGRVRLHAEAFDIRELADEVVQELQEMTTDKKLYLRVEASKSTLPPAYGDRERVKQILINLISNSVHYTVKGGITISLGTVPGRIVVSIADTGIGIPPERQVLLFRKFSTIRNTFLNTKEYGSGLGLYIGRLLAEAMGGSLRLAKSEVGIGSTFVLEMPAKK